MHPVRLSAIVITKNEGANIAACLDSLEFCDERIIIDSGSNDDTVRLAQSKGARVTNHNWQGFGAQKNFALSLATGDWVLSIDADERVSPPLAALIKKAIGDASIDG
jgi:glycosyltransferase involved in cell wall biosynthesis